MIEEKELERKPSTIRDWLNDHRPEIEVEAKRRNMTAVHFIIMMLEDALSAYKAGRHEND